MSTAAISRQRLPCVALFLWAAAGVLAGRFLPVPGWIFAAAAVPVLLAALSERLRHALPMGILLVFATAQTWQYRESPAVQLATRLTLEPQVCEATIQVLEAPHLSPDSPRSRFVAQLDTLDLAGQSRPAACPILVLWNGAPPVYGGIYHVRASISNCPPQRNPGAFDYTSWLADSGIRSQMQVVRAGDATLLRLGGNPIVRFAIASCAWIERTISLGIDGTDEAALIRGMTIGDTTNAPDSLKDAFRITGTYHLFSVSGLHVALVAAMLWFALGWFGLSRRHAILIIIPAIFFYALITGLSAASLRAAIMVSVLAAAPLFDRAATPLNSMGAAGLGLLVWDSSQLFNSGFQLSFGAVVAIFLIAGPLQRQVEGRFKPDPFVPRQLVPPGLRVALSWGRETAAVIVVSLAAWIASLPLIIYYFHLVSFYSIPSNMVAIPLSSFILALATVSLVVGTVFPSLAALVNHANFWVAKALIFSVTAFASLPGSSAYVGLPAPSDTVAQIVVLDAADGGAVALFAGHAAWLVDGGPGFFASAVTLPFLRSSGVNRLDALVLTHGDIKHIGGFDRLAPALLPRMILDSGLPDRSPTRRRILHLLDPKAVRTATAGAAFTLAPSTRVTVLYPPPNVPGIDADDKAIVLRVEVGKFSALLMSDAGLATEQWLLAHAADHLPCDFIAMGRHSSGFSGGEDFLRAAHPQALAATWASYPDTQRIRPEWAQTVHDLGIALYRQDETGAVTVTVRADSFVVTPFLSGAASPRTFSDAVK